MYENGVDIHLVILKHKLARQLEVGGIASNGQYGLWFFSNYISKVFQDITLKMV